MWTAVLMDGSVYKPAADKWYEREQLKHIYLMHHTDEDRAISTKMLHVFAQLVKFYISTQFIAETSWDPAK